MGSKYPPRILHFKRELLCLGVVIIVHVLKYISIKKNKSLTDAMSKSPDVIKGYETYLVNRRIRC